jgi:hypothetical protein
MILSEVRRKMTTSQLTYDLAVARSDSTALISGTRLISRSARLLPIVFFQIYLNFTVFLFAFGPWPWPVDGGFKLYGFLALAHVALLLGYLSAAFREPHGYRGKWTVKQLVTVSLFLNIVLLLPTSAFRSGKAIPDVVGGLADPATVYFKSNATRAEGGSLVEYVRIILGPLLFLLLPLTIFYWKRLHRIVRILSLISILGFLSIYVAIGTNKALADAVLLLPCMTVASYCAGDFRIARRRIFYLLVTSFALFFLFFLFFSTSNIARVGDEANTGKESLIGISANPDNFLFRELPTKLRIGVTGLIGYITQGYYGLYLSLEEPFVPMFGVGNSMFLYFNAVEITGNEAIQDLPYPVRVEKHSTWPAYTKWHSIYPWLASDVSFPGTILVVFFIGRLFAMAWLDTLKGENPYAVAVLAQFVIMLFYFPANNQVLQSGEALFGFYGLLVFWFFTRRKCVCKVK